VRPESLKLLQENIGKKLVDIGIGNDLLNRTPIAWEIRARTDKLDGVKCFCKSKEIINRKKRQYQYVRKIFARYSSKDQCPKYRI
jgi:hypothetical protein